MALLGILPTENSLISRLGSLSWKHKTFSKDSNVLNPSRKSDEQSWRSSSRIKSIFDIFTIKSQGFSRIVFANDGAEIFTLDSVFQVKCLVLDVKFFFGGLTHLIRNAVPSQHVTS